MADTTEANLFELDGPGVSVTYATSSFEGEPQFSFRGGDRELDTSGDRIYTNATELGIEVSIILDAIPDAEMLTLTLLVPTVNVARGGDADVSTVLIEKTARTTVGGPRLVDGQVETYRVIELSGKARALEF